MLPFCSGQTCAAPAPHDTKTTSYMAVMEIIRNSLALRQRGPRRTDRFYHSQGWSGVMKPINLGSRPSLPIGMRQSWFGIISTVPPSGGGVKKLASPDSPARKGAGERLVWGDLTVAKLPNPTAVRFPAGGGHPGSGQPGGIWDVRAPVVTRNGAAFVGHVSQSGAGCAAVGAACSTVGAACSTVGAACTTVGAACTTVSAACTAVGAACTSVSAACTSVGAGCIAEGATRSATGAVRTALGAAPRRSGGAVRCP